MATSSHGPRAFSAWPATQKPASRTRVVRLGRPANDNAAQPQPFRRVMIFAAAGALAALALHYLGMF